MIPAKAAVLAVLAFALASPARAGELVADSADAIDIARSVCRVDLGETDSGPHWRAERSGISWRVRGDETYQVWVRASDGQASGCQVCAHEGANSSNEPCVSRDGKRPVGW